MKTIFTWLAVLVLSANMRAAQPVQTYTDQTVKFSQGSKLTLDPTSQIRDEDGNWILSNAELGYLDGVTSALQTQINALSGTGTSLDPTQLTNVGGILRIKSGAALTNAALSTASNTGTFSVSGTMKSQYAEVTNSVIVLGKASFPSSVGVQTDALTIGKDSTTPAGWIQSYGTVAGQSLQLNPMGGNVTVGMQSIASSTLHVYSESTLGAFKVSTAFNTNAFLIDTNGTQTINAQSGAALVVNTNWLSVTNAKVGIGMALPTQALDVTGNIMINGSGKWFQLLPGSTTLKSSGAFTISLDNGASSIDFTNGNSGFRTSVPTATAHIYSTNTLGAFKISTDFNTNVMVVLTNGSTSLGTNNGTSRLHVSSATNRAAVTVQIEDTTAQLGATETLIDFRSTAGSEGSIAFTAAPGVIGWNSFTGSHYTSVAGTNEPTLFALLEIIPGNPTWAKRVISPPRIEIATNLVDVEIEPAQTNVVDGVTNIIAAVMGTQTVYVTNTIPEVAFQASPKTQLFRTRVCRTLQSKAAIGAYGGKDNEGRDMVFSIGTGFLWVANKGVNLETGDYLISSDVLGCAEKQADDVKHNYTVGKCTEAVDWTALGNPARKKVKVVYQGG